MYTNGMRSGLFITLIVALLPVAAGAQSLDSIVGAGSTAFTVSVSPQYPSPNSQATISFASSLIDLANSSVSVSVNGKNIYRGAIQPLAVATGREGSVTNVEVTVTSGDVPHRQSLSIQPQDVVLVAEPFSSAPPLYLGKPAVPPSGDVRVVAVANVRDESGRAIPPSSLSYSWTVDGTQIANSSGIGKESLVVASPFPYRLRAVSVAVTSQDNSLRGGASLSLSAGEPVVRIYENDPLLGILFDKALSSFDIRGAEATLYAAAFSFPTTGGNPLLRWFLDGSSAESGSSITLRPTGSGRGSSSLSLVASARGDITAAANIPLSFGSSSRTNFFGL